MTAAEAKANTIASKESQEKERREMLLKHIKTASDYGGWTCTYYRSYAYVGFTGTSHNIVWEPMDSEWIRGLGYQLDDSDERRYVVISWGP